MVKIELNLSEIDFLSLAEKILPQLDGIVSTKPALAVTKAAIHIMSEETRERTAVRICEEHKKEISQYLEKAASDNGVNIKVKSLKISKPGK